MDPYFCRPARPSSSPCRMDLKFETKIVPVFTVPTNYNDLENKPKINGVELFGDKTNEELNIKAITTAEIDVILAAI